MDHVDILQAKDSLAELIARAKRGEDVRISDGENGTVRLLPVEQNARHKAKRMPGRLAGKLRPPPDDFFDPLSDEDLKFWYGAE